MFHTSTHAALGTSPGPPLLEELEMNAPFAHRTGAALVALVLATAPACFVPMHEATTRFTETIEVSGPLSLEVISRAGSTCVRRGERDDEAVIKARVTARAHDDRDAERLARLVAEDPPIDVFDGRLVVGDLDRYFELRNAEWWEGDVTIDLQIAVPADTSVLIDSKSGETCVEDIDGSVRIETRSGDVLVQRIGGDVSVDVHSGNVTIEDVPAADVVSRSGNVRVSRVPGPVRIEAESGEVLLGDVGPKVTAHTKSGDVKIDSVMPSEADWQARTHSGNVELRLPASASFALEFDTGSGGLRSSFVVDEVQSSGKRLVGQVGDAPTGRVRVTTSSGDLHLRRR